MQYFLKRIAEHEYYVSHSSLVDNCIQKYQRNGYSHPSTLHLETDTLLKTQITFPNINNVDR